MLNANARSKAKLPICAMLGDPQVFFQKPAMEATGTESGQRLGRLGSSPISGLLSSKDFNPNRERRKQPRRTQRRPRTGHPLLLAHTRKRFREESGGRGSAARQFKIAGSMR